MFGRIIRAASYSVVAWILAYVLQQVGQPMIKVIKAGDQDAPKVVEYLSVALDNILFVFIISLLVMLIAGAVTERRLGGGI